MEEEYYFALGWANTCRRKRGYEGYKKIETISPPHGLNQSIIDMIYFVEQVHPEPFTILTREKEVISNF